MREDKIRENLYWIARKSNGNRFSGGDISLDDVTIFLESIMMVGLAGLPIDKIAEAIIEHDTDGSAELWLDVTAKSIY